jgi:hypothetical protein
MHRWLFFPNKTRIPWKVSGVYYRYRLRFLPSAYYRPISLTKAFFKDQAR